MSKEVFIVLRAQVDDDQDIVDLDGSLYELPDQISLSELSNVEYWHVSYEGYDEKPKPEKRKRKKRKP